MAHLSCPSSSCLLHAGCLHPPSPSPLPFFARFGIAFLARARTVASISTVYRVVYTIRRGGMDNLTDALEDEDDDGIRTGKKCCV